MLKNDLNNINTIDKKVSGIYAIVNTLIAKGSSITAYGYKWRYAS